MFEAKKVHEIKSDIFIMKEEEDKKLKKKNKNNNDVMSAKISVFNDLNF